MPSTNNLGVDFFDFFICLVFFWGLGGMELGLGWDAGVGVGVVVGFGVFPELYNIYLRFC